MNTNEKIESLKKRIAAIREYLPYADGPAYYQDLDCIRKIQDEIEILEKAARKELN